MSKKIFGNAEPKCKYCEYGQISPDGTCILCVKMGVFDPEHSCKKYKYDPLKRVPQSPPPMPDFTADDFKL